ncbi:restriction endonuclease subunit S [Kluyvera cryocrescens]|uniref:restriction endonuclease subunit S n=1 Tax=Kluyvera cryocrescens TaxID=580 RepID=UPI002DB95BA7|nr:restriction endonuclease subunit S [Kluyvera cryocrescens]MEB6633433.1 restriction endonuclease subunit S [Kluyvera cryocrescens]
MTVEKLITDHIDIWSSALQTRSTAGRGSNGKIDLYGIKKLRELILELAVRGKLVSQDPNDEPASELLKRIADEKAELVKQGKIKKQKPLPEISEDEKPFELPEGWEWTRLGDIVKVSSGDGLTSSQMEVSGDIPVYGGNGINGYHDSFNVSKRTLVIGRVGFYCGSIHVTPSRAWVTDNAFKTEFSEENLYLDFLRVLLTITNLKENENATAQPVISGKKIYPIVVAIPPYQEQRSIVKKVEELMFLCEQLEQQSLTSLDAHQQLVETLLSTLTDSQNAEELAENWARISQHFNTLFTTEASIDALKQTILQLAVMGKLVPQDPNDEPASELLKRIEQEKAQLVKEGKIKKQKPLPPVSDEEKPFELPEGWKWCRLGDLAIGSEAGWSPQCEPHPRNGDDWGVLKISSVTWGEFNPEENKALPVKLEPRQEYEVKGKDFLLSRANTSELVARSVVVPQTVPKHLMLSDKIIRFQFSDLLDVNYINIVNNSMLSREYYGMVAGGTSASMKNVTRNQVSLLPVALPPYNEQINIISVIESMSLFCDALKELIASSEQIKKKLTDSITFHL